jgi:phosphoglycerol transferase
MRFFRPLKEAEQGLAPNKIGPVKTLARNPASQTLGLCLLSCDRPSILMPVSFFISAITLALAVLALHFTHRSTKRSVIFLSLALVVASSLYAYAAANSFTGEGINEEVVFHLQYGLRGAGFWEYRGLIATSALAVLLTAIGFSYLCLARRHHARRRFHSAASWGCLALAGLLSPGLWNVWQLARPKEPSGDAQDFYHYYKLPRLTELSSDHPNFVFIFAESLERTYFDETIFPGLIKELRALEDQGVSFTNIHTLDGAGSTIGGMVASLCGIPLFSPAHVNAMSGMDSFLGGATGLSDVLQAKGYHLEFMGGAALKFAGKGLFLQSHHFDRVAGFSELHGNVADKEYINNWGLYDDTLLELAFTRFTELGKSGKPFGLFLLTLDTHHPDGHVSHSATVQRYGTGENPMLNAVAASDQMIAAFVRRVRSSRVGANTVVVIASDHLAMNNAASDLLQRGERRNLFLVLDPRTTQPEKISRRGSTLDTGATFLPFLGYQSSIGLGRDLRDPKTSDDEIAYIHEPDRLGSWREEITKFWEFPEFRRSLSFSEAEEEVAIDSRRFRAPVLVELESRNRTKLRFEFDALYDVRLAEQAARLEPGTDYVLIAKRGDVPALTGGGPMGKTTWVAVIGKSGEGSVEIPLGDGEMLSRAQVELHLKTIQTGQR